MDYIPRIVDAELSKKLSRSGAVYVRGPKWCGKTSTCERLAASALKMRDPDSYATNMEAAEVQPSLLLRGKRPRLVDEWQVAPVLWDAVINDVDAHRGEPGQFLLTGSATPPDHTKLRHSGTGRIARLSMDPMTLAESGESTCEVSLAALFASSKLSGRTGQTNAAVSDEETIREGVGDVEGMSHVTIERYAELICAGGWPAPIAHGALDAHVAADYLDALCETDIAEASGIALDPDRAHALLHSLARNTAQEASHTTILADVKDAGIGMSEPTLRVYLAALRSLFVIEDSKAWAPALRSRTPLRSSPVRYLCDPSLAAAALGVNADGLLSDLVTMGYLFECLCVRDLRVYARALGGDVYHYRDKGGLEVDVIVRLADGRWAGIEVKLGGQGRIDEGAKNLLALAGKVDAERSGAPSYLMVLTGGQYAYTRSDGVHVVPLACLGA